MKTWTLYDAATGMIRPGALTCSDAQIAANVPEGYAALEGAFDPLSQAVDLNTGQVVDYQPPAPADDELRTWAWDAETKRWAAQPTLAALKDAKLAEIKAAREAAIDAPKATSFGTFDATPEARANIAAVVAIAQTAAKHGYPSNVFFTLADNSRIEFTLDQIESAALQVGAQVQAAFDKQATLYAQIDAAETVEDLQAIHW